MRRSVARFLGVCLVVLAVGPESLETQAAEIRELYRGARQKGMGGAGLALADDEQAVYLNPAGLAGNKKTYFYPLILDTTISTGAVLSYLDGGTTFSNFSPTTISSLIGTNYFAQVQATPTFLIRQLAVSLYVDAQAALLTKNLALPQVTIGYMNTYGVQAAYGLSLWKRRRGHGELRLGFAGKVLWRRGGYRQQTLADLLSLSATSLASFAGPYKMAYSGDIGLQYVQKVSRGVILSAGVTGQNLGALDFGLAGVDRVEEVWSAGVAADLSLRGLPDFRFAYDYRNLTLATDWRLKQHLGVEIGLPFVTAQAGIGQSYLSYGAAFDLWILKVSATAYGAELGSQAFQEVDRRWMLRIGTKLPL